MGGKKKERKKNTKQQHNQQTSHEQQWLDSRNKTESFTADVSFDPMLSGELQVSLALELLMMIR